MLEIPAFFIGLYILLIIWVIFEMTKIKTENFDKIPPAKKFSILIPFRNEEKNLKKLVDSLNHLNYPSSLFEVIFINDRSTDQGEKIIHQNIHVPYQLISIRKKNTSPKKEALEKGINLAKFPYIITTDADCILPENWLMEYNGKWREKNTKMILGPVKYSDKPSFINQFQILEFLSLQAFTMAGVACGNPFLSNGANLSFLKKAFQQVDGYTGNKHIVSGDDVFLTEKFRKNFPGEIKFLKSPGAIVNTHAQPDRKNLFQQKIRWASKSSKIKNPMNQLMGFVILTGNFSLLYLFFLLPFSPLSVFILFFLKILFDWLLVSKTNNFYQNHLKTKYFLLTELTYPFYLLWIVWGMKKKNYTWKGNKYNT